MGGSEGGREVWGEKGRGREGGKEVGRGWWWELITYTLAVHSHMYTIQEEDKRGRKS